jgi:hypothetical protein
MTGFMDRLLTFILHRAGNVWRDEQLSLYGKPRTTEFIFVLIRILNGAAMMQVQLT